MDATAIARSHGIGSHAVVIVNTTILGAYAHMLGVPLDVLERAYASLGLDDDLAAAEAAYAAVEVRDSVEPGQGAVPASAPTSAIVLPPVAPLLAHNADHAPTLHTGAWSSQEPVYRDRPAPCNQACPAGNDVVGFIQALKNEGPEAAAAILLRTQALPAVCGRVCPAPCMEACNRGAFDGAVNIRSLERWIADHAALRPAQQAAAQRRRFAVVGGGPAGLSAAYQLALRGHAVEIHEAGPAPGGVLRNGIPAFRLPAGALQRDLDRLLGLGIAVQCSSRVDAVALKRLGQENDAVIVCTGFGAALDLAVGEKNLDGVEQGLDFLERSKQGGVSVHGQVVVVGGGNTAIDCARSALRSGAAGVKLVYRRSRDAMPAIAEEIADAEQEGVRLLPLRQPVGFGGEGAVSSIRLAEVDLGAPDASGRPRPVVSGRVATIACDLVLLALGQARVIDVLPAGWQVRGGRAWRDEEALAVWLAGDCCKRRRHRDPRHRQRTARRTRGAGRA